jgi:hypothetical protein
MERRAREAAAEQPEEVEEAPEAEPVMVRSQPEERQATKATRGKRSN